MSTSTNRATIHPISIRWDLCSGQTPDSVLNHLKDVIQKKLDASQIFESPIADGSIALFQTVSKNPTESSAIVTIRRHNKVRLVTVNVEYSVDWNSTSQDAQRAINRTIDELRDELNDCLGGGVERIPGVKIGSSVPNYYASSDDRIFEYDFDEVLFDKKSEYQQVKILKSKTLGNALFLDDLQNLAEKDLPYTHGLMHYGHVDYKDKDILILGGGDGGLLHELLKENPKHVTMIDIDEVVVDACRVHLRGACGNVLDTLKTDKYTIIIGDAIKHLEEYGSHNRKFDVIFNDLTDIPLSSGASQDEVSANLWAFIKNILALSFACLPSGGKYLNHAIGSGCTQALETYEQVIKDLPYETKFIRHANFVPSFLEEWVFYDITKID